MFCILYIALVLLPITNCVPLEDLGITSWDEARQHRGYFITSALMFLMNYVIIHVTTTAV